MKPGEAIIIFTPDSTPHLEPLFRLKLIKNTATHFPIALYAIERGLHVLVTKPATKLLSHHNELIEAAKKNNVVCWVEHHKRCDTMSLIKGPRSHLS